MDKMNQIAIVFGLCALVFVQLVNGQQLPSEACTTALNNFRGDSRCANPSVDTYCSGGVCAALVDAVASACTSEVRHN